MKKMLFVLFILFFCCFVFAQEQDFFDDFFKDLSDDLVFETDNTLTNFYQNKVDEYNSEGINGVPSHFIGIYGNEIANLDLVLNNGKKVVVGIKLVDGRIVELRRYGYEDPTMTITTTEQDIRDVFVSKDPKSETINKLISQKIKVNKKGMGDPLFFLGIIGFGIIVVSLIVIFVFLAGFLKKIMKNR